MAHHPTGQNVIVAVACFDGENQEDALIFNRQSIEQGMFKYSRYYTEVLSNDTEELNMFGTDMYHKTASKRSNIRFGLNDAIHDNMTRYRHISRKGGLPKPGIFLNPRDCIIAAYENDEIDRSVYVKEDGAGYVDRVTVTRNFAGNPVVKVRIRQVLEPIVGDKFASRHAQKATIGRIAEAEDMPYVKETGLRPDIIINPHCLTGDTLVSMSGGVSRRIDSLAGEDNISEEVWGWNGKELETKSHLGLEYKGKRRVYQLTLADGRTIKSTAEHRVLTSEGEWVEARNLIAGETSLSMGLELPEDKRCRDRKSVV
jgi:DNA-directed RNA polymerase II subunit RPB2